MILIYSTLRDPHALAVEAILRERMGRQVEIVDLAQFPRLLRMTVTVDAGSVEHRLQLADGTTIDQESVTAVWWRRPQPFAIHPEVHDTVYRSFSESECASAFNGFWLNSRCLWVNPIEADRRASRKAHQLAVASELGLDVPATLITNDPAAARAFWERQGREVVFKAFVGMDEAWRETRKLEHDDLLELESVRFAPTIFQEHVPAGADLRVTVIGDRVFAAELDTAASKYPTDVRMDMTVPCTRATLPRDLERKLLALMRFLGLEYGAIDLRRDPAGRYRFLEINPAGQYLYIERLTGMPISQAFAEHLARGTARTTRGNWQRHDHSGRGNHGAKQRQSS